MAADNVQVNIDADESGLAAAIARAKAQLDSFDQKVIASGQRLAELFKRADIDPAFAFKRLSPESQQALATYYASQQKVIAGTKELSGATEQMGGAFRIAGVNVESMFATMATRMAVIGGFVFVLKQIHEGLVQLVAIGEAKRQYDSLADSVEHAGRNFTLLTESSKAAQTAIPQIEKMADVMVGYGMDVDVAAVQTESLAKAAKFLTTNEKDAAAMGLTLADAMGRLHAGEVLSDKQIRLLATATGTASAENIKLLNTYVELQRVGPAAIKAIDDNLRVLQETERNEEQQRERADRQAEQSQERRLSAIEKLAQAQEKGLLQAPATAQERVYQGLGIPTAQSTAKLDAMTAAFEQATQAPSGGQVAAMQRLLAGGGPLPGQQLQAMLDPSMIARYQQGIEALAGQLPGGTPAQVHRLIAQGAFTSADVMRAAKESHEDAAESTRYAAQDQMETQRETAEAQKRGIAQQTQDAREIAETGIRRGLVSGAPGVQKAFEEVGGPPGARLAKDLMSGWSTFIGESLKNLFPTKVIEDQKDIQQKTFELLNATFGGTT
jgi:hypothetical protein